jgi:hypothetical protein
MVATVESIGLGLPNIYEKCSSNPLNCYPTFQKFQNALNYSYYSIWKTPKFPQNTSSEVTFWSGCFFQKKIRFRNVTFEIEHFWTYVLKWLNIYLTSLNNVKTKKISLQNLHSKINYFWILCSKVYPGVISSVWGAWGAT